MTRTWKVRIKTRIRTADGSRRYVNPVFTNNGKLKPQYAIVGGKQEHHPEGEYYLRYRDGKPRWDRVGPDAQLAVVERLKRQKALEAKAAGVTVVEVKDGKDLKVAAEEYLNEILVARRQTTFRQKELAVRYFLQSCKKRYVEQIERCDHFSHIAYLRQMGLGETSVFKNMMIVGHLMKRWGGVHLKMNELPKPTKTEANAYSTEQLQRLFGAADRDEYELCQMYLCTGFRELEGVFARYGDVDFDRKTVAVKKKDDLKFFPKDHEERVVPVPDSLITMLRERRLRNPNDKFIFSGKNGGRLYHSLRILKRLALRAGLNCGECMDKKGRSCKDHPVCSLIELHRFRRTFATRLAENGMPAKEIQKLLGHARLETTELYLAPLYRTQAKTRSLVNGAFDLGAEAVAA